MRTWDLQEREFGRKVNQALIDVAKDLAKHYNYDLPQTNYIDRVSSNYYVVNINNIFDSDNLEFYLSRALENQGLREDIQYGIFDCTSNQMVTGKLIKYTKETKALDKDDALFPHTDKDFIYYFGVRFPNKRANILSNMWWVLAFTGLMLITVLFFLYSMYIILRQKQLSEMQRDFINNMTHEFKTPISTINVSTDVFLKSETIANDPRLNRYAGIIKEQIMRLNNQVEKVLQLAKIERENVELHLEKTDLNELLAHISPSLEIKINDKKGALTLDLPADHIMIMADKLHLTNIIHNLVDNGVKYSTQPPEITIKIKKEGKNAVLSVTDKGIGIPKEFQNKVFDKFFRVPTGNVHNVKGFGLGLFYVLSLCQEHGWKLGLLSSPGAGTTIHITIPMTAI